MNSSPIKDPVVTEQLINKIKTGSLAKADAAIREAIANGVDVTDVLAYRKVALIYAANQLKANSFASTDLPGIGSHVSGAVLNADGTYDDIGKVIQYKQRQRAIKEMELFRELSYNEQWERQQQRALGASMARSGMAPGQMPMTVLDQTNRINSQFNEGALQIIGQSSLYGNALSSRERAAAPWVIGGKAFIKSFIDPTAPLGPEGSSTQGHIAKIDTYPMVVNHEYGIEVARSWQFQKIAAGTQAEFIGSGLGRITGLFAEALGISSVARAITRKIGTSAVRNGIEDLSLLTEQRAAHVLYGDVTGGGHKWGLTRIFNGKDKFPMSWSDQKILNTISDVATDPTLKQVWTRGAHGSLYTKKGLTSRYYVEGIRDGIKIRSVYEPATGSIITGFPIR